MQIKENATTPVKLKGIVQHTKSETVCWLIGSMLFGGLQTVLIFLAFSSGPNAATLARDVEVAKLVLEKCEVFSSANLVLRRDGSKDVGCSIDLRFFNQIENMKKRLRKQRRKKNKPSA